MDGSFIYFLHDKTTGAIKIGTSTNPDHRFRMIRTTTASEVIMIRAVPIDDGYGVERHLHQKFADLWIRGEWFRATPELVLFAQTGEVPRLPPSQDGGSPEELPSRDARGTIKLVDLAARSGLPERTIRYYIAEELLDPPVRGGRGAVYSEDHLRQLEQIAIWKNNKMTHEDIRALRVGRSERAQIGPLELSIQNATPEELKLFHRALEAVSKIYGGPTTSEASEPDKET